MPAFKTAILPKASLQVELFRAGGLDILESLGDVVRNDGDEALECAQVAELVADCDAIVTSWGVKTLDAEALEGNDRLKVVAHAAGTVKGIVSDALWDRGVLVSSAACAIAIEVAEDALWKVIGGLKNAFRISRAIREGGWYEHAAAPARTMGLKKIGVVSASHVGRQMMRLLENFDCEVLLYDPFVSEEGAEEFGARKVELDELCRESEAISIHAPSIEATNNMFDASRLATMRDDCVLVNTARGSIVDEAALIGELQKGRFLAFIDVTDPEPPADDSPLRALDNVVLTPHIAGGNDNRWRLGLHAAHEIERALKGEALVGGVTQKMLETIA